MFFTWPKMVYLTDKNKAFENDSYLGKVIVLSQPETVLEISGGG